METEPWKSPRRIQAEADAAYEAQIEARRELRMKVGNALADVILDGLMKPSEAKRVYINQFPEVKQNV